MKISNLPFGLMLKTVEEKGLSGLLEWLDFCARNGLDGVEIGEDWLRYLSWADAALFVDAVRAAPIEVSGLAVHNRMNCPPGESRDEAGFSGWISYEAHERVGLEGIASGARFARRLWAELD